MQDEVAFADLGLAVIDEQHRFGVHQRLALGDKGEGVDVLAMTATPIPRTLALAYFGDMEFSALREKPPGRLPIDTRAVNVERIDEVVAGLGRAIKTGARVYWVCPLVEGSEDCDLAAAQDRAEDLRKFFGAQVGLVHGQMKGRDKDAAMEAFAAGDTKVLVATTVIEVGVNVPEATIMVIEHAERFGLSQLHQLRGRVGRGAAKSSCILLYAGPLGETAAARLEILRETEDGFRIAEEDLRLRGEGEVLGVRQSGAPGFKIARLDLHADLFRFARDDAEARWRTIPTFQRERAKGAAAALHVRARSGPAAAARRLDGLWSEHALTHGEGMPICGQPVSTLDTESAKCRRLRPSAQLPYSKCAWAVIKETNMAFRPLHDRVVLQRLEGEEKTKGGIIIPDTAKEKPQEGEVVAVGPGARDEAGKLVPLDVKAGDRVLFGKWSGTEVKIDGEDLLIMKESDILGVVALSADPPFRRT